MEKLRLERVGKNRMGYDAYKDENGRYYLDIDFFMDNPTELYCCSPHDDMNGEADYPLDKPFEIVNPYNEKEIRMKHYRPEYGMLSRLNDECEAFFGRTGDEWEDSVDCRYHNERNIWGLNINRQIIEMKRLWNKIPDDIKPEWCSWEKILIYERKAKAYNHSRIGTVPHPDMNSPIIPSNY